MTIYVFWPLRVFFDPWTTASSSKDADFSWYDSTILWPQGSNVFRLNPSSSPMPLTPGGPGTGRSRHWYAWGFSLRVFKFINFYLLRIHFLSKFRIHAYKYVNSWIKWELYNGSYNWSSRWNNEHFVDYRFAGPIHDFVTLPPFPNRQRLSFALLPTSFERVLLCLFQNDICISRLIVLVTKRSGSGAGLIRTITGRARHTQ